MVHPKDVGDRSMLAVMLNGAALRRVQCKSGRYRKGAVRFATCSTYGHHPHPKIKRRDYNGQIDDFAVYCHDLGTVYLVPIEDVPALNSAALRVDPPRNNQYANVRFAAPYEIVRFELL